MKRLLFNESGGGLGNVDFTVPDKLWSGNLNAGRTTTIACDSPPKLIVISGVSNVSTGVGALVVQYMPTDEGCQIDYQGNASACLPSSGKFVTVTGSEISLKNSFSTGSQYRIFLAVWY